MTAPDPPSPRAEGPARRPSAHLWPIAGTPWVLMVTENGLRLIKRGQAFEITGDDRFLVDEE